jgi:phosphate-selective porin OprO/OprP
METPLHPARRCGQRAHARRARTILGGAQAVLVVITLLTQMEQPAGTARGDDRYWSAPAADAESASAPAIPAYVSAEYAVVPSESAANSATGEAEVLAAQPPAATAPLDPEIESILKRLDALEKPTAPQAPEKAEKKEGEKDPLAGWTDLSAEKWDVRLGGHLQIDSINWADADDPPVPADNYFEFRRVRLMADGHGYGVYDFRLMIDAEPESGDGVAAPVVDVKDAYLSMNEVPFFDRLRIGNFFVPFGLEQVTNDTNNIFLERSIPTQGIFTADRELGMAFYGINDAQDFTYSGGVFVDNLSESLKERIDDNQGQRLSGRLTWLPYYDEPSNGRYLVHTGCGILYTHEQDDLSRFRARPQIHEGPFLIDTGNIPTSSTTTGNVEFATVWGRFTLQSEAYLCDVNRIGADDEILYGGYAHLSCFLTGENRTYERYGMHGAQFGRQQVYSNFFWVPGCVGPGAWEVKARYSNLSLDDAGAGQYNDFTAGFNWYWSERIRVMFDWIHPMTSTSSTPFGATTSDIIGMRFDFNW